MLLAVLMLTMAILTSATNGYAQGQTPSASDATSTSNGVTKPTPSDAEIKKVLSRTLDKLEATQKASAAKDEVIVEQDRALAESETGKKAATEAARNFKEAYEKQTEATRIAKEGWDASEKRVRDLEKKVRGSNNRVKWMALGAAAAVVATILIK